MHTEITRRKQYDIKYTVRTISSKFEGEMIVRYTYLVEGNRKKVVIVLQEREHE